MKKPPIPSTYEFILAFSSVLFNRFPKRFQRMRENGRRIAGRLQVLYINGAVTHDIIHIMSWVILHMKKEMTGKQFGMLTVLQEAKRENSRKRYWLCRCQCGKETVVEESHLKNGHTKSCGCYRRMVQQKRSRDLTGLRFGRLRVLEAVLGTDGSLAGWKCQCDCGKQCICKSGSLTSGVTRSCGCLQEEKRRATEVSTGEKTIAGGPVLDSRERCTILVLSAALRMQWRRGFRLRRGCMIHFLKNMQRKKKIHPPT